jgi:hypothetical protein
VLGRWIHDNIIENKNYMRYKGECRTNCPKTLLSGCFITYESSETCILIYIQQGTTLHSLFYLVTALHVLGGTITHHQERNNCIYSIWCHTIIAICRYRGRVGTGLSVHNPSSGAQTTVSTASGFVTLLCYLPLSWKSWNWFECAQHTQTSSNLSLEIWGHNVNIYIYI